MDKQKQIIALTSISATRIVLFKKPKFAKYMKPVSFFTTQVIAKSPKVRWC